MDPVSTRQPGGTRRCPGPPPGATYLVALDGSGASDAFAGQLALVVP